MCGEWRIRRIIVAALVIAATVLAVFAALPCVAHAKYYSAETDSFTLNIERLQNTEATLKYELVYAQFEASETDHTYKGPGAANAKDIPVDCTYPLVDGSATVSVASWVPDDIEGYKFRGWTTDLTSLKGGTLKDEMVYLPNDSITLTGNTTLYSVWVPDGTSDNPSPATRALYVKYMESTATYNIYEVYAGEDSADTKLLKKETAAAEEGSGAQYYENIEPTNLYKTLCELSTGYSSVEINTVNAIRCAYGTRDTNGNWDGDIIAPPTGCTWLFTRWSGSNEPIFWPSADQSTTKSDATAALRLQNVTLDGSTNATGSIYPLIYTNQSIGVYNVELVDVTLQNNNRTYNSSDSDATYGSAISLGRYATQSTGFWDLVKLEINYLRGLAGGSYSIEKHSYLKLVDCTISNCSGSEGLIYVDEYLVPTNPATSKKTSEVQSIEITSNKADATGVEGIKGLVVSNCTALYDLCVRSYETGPSGILLYGNDDEKRLFVDEVPGGVDYHKQTVFSSTNDPGNTLIALYTDGTNSFYGMDADSKSMVTTTGIDAEYSINLSANSGYSLVPNITVALDDGTKSYSVPTNCSIGETVEGSGGITFTKTEEGKGTLKIPATVNTSAVTQISISAYQYTELVLVHTNMSEVASVKKSMDLDGTITATYQLQLSEVLVDNENVYLYTFLADGSVSCWPMTYHTPGTTMYNALHASFASTPNYALSYDRIDDVLTVTITGSAADKAFQSSNMVYISLTDPEAVSAASLNEADETTALSMMSLDDVDVEAVEDELEPEEEAIELVDADGEKVNADQDSAVDTEAESEDEVESSEGASAPKKASGNFSNLSLATVDLDADYSLNVDAEDELIGGSDDVLSEGADAALTDGSGEVLGDGSGDGVPGDLAEDGADAALGDGQGDGSNGAVDEESSGLLDSSTEERGGETSAQVSSVLAQVFFAKGMSEQGTVGASWTEASATASDAGELVSGRLMVQFDGGAQPAQVYAWAVAADGVPQDAGGAWRAAAESGTLVYSSDPAVEAQLLASGDARVGFEYDGDARVGFLTLGDVPSDGLVSDDGTLKIVVCVTDASVQTALQEVAANLGSQLEAQAPVQAGAGVPSRDATLCGTELQALLQRRAEYFVALLAGGGEAAGEDGDAAGAGGGDAAATTEVAEVAEVPVIVEAAADGGDAAAGAGTEGAGTEDNVQAQVAEQAATEAAEVAESAGQSPEQTQSAPAESVADSAGTAVTTETLQVEAAVVEEQGEGFSAGADEAAVEPAAEADAVPVIMDTMPADDNGSGALDAAA